MKISTREMINPFKKGALDKAMINLR